MILLLSESRHKNGTHHIHLWKSWDLKLWNIWTNYFLYHNSRHDIFPNSLSLSFYLKNSEVGSFTRLINISCEMFFMDIL